MANFPGSMAAGAPAGSAPAAAAPAAVTSSALLGTSEALAPPTAPEAAPVLPQGVTDANAPEAPAEPPALDANPYKTAAAVETHLAGAGVDPFLAKFYGGRLQQALQRPAPTADELAAGHADVETALNNEYGDTAEHIGRLAREEMHRLSRDFPDLPQLLERTGLGNDLQVIKALASRGYERVMAEKRAEFGLPPARK